MADIQKQLVAFHDAIQLTDLEDNKPLRDNRNNLLDELRAGLNERYEDSDESAPTFEHRNQGSYAMGTGIKPSGGRDYDIDVALLFNVDPADWPDPTKLKELVRDILDSGTHSATMNRPCVTVTFDDGTETRCHVDFPIYAASGDQRPLPQLALGYPGSDEDKKEWQDSDFQGLLKSITGRFADKDDQLQFRRVIRYLKRWKDFRFPSTGEGAPRGIGLTCAAYDHFSPRRVIDPVSRHRSYDDLAALKALIGSMLQGFFAVEGGRGFSACLPAEPHDNPFERMSPKQVAAFETKLKELHEALCTASNEESAMVASEELVKHFGSDFPVPEAKAAGAPAVISTGHYA